MKIFRSVIISCLLLLACEPSTPSSSINDGATEVPEPQVTARPTPSVSGTPTGPTQELRTIDGARPSLQLLSTDQIRNHLKCIDSRFELTTIKSESIMAIGATPNSGTDAFLLPNLYSVGDDIIERNADLIDGPQNLTKTGTKLNNPSLDYLVALSNIGNVVAHNCSILHKNNNLKIVKPCDCKTSDGAMKMVSECLAVLSLSDNSLQMLYDSLQEQCNEDPKAAISSLIASWGYVISP